MMKSKTIILVFLQVFYIEVLFLIQSCDSLSVRPGEMWPNGVVKYKLDTSLTLKDMSEIKKAIDEFHTKTCIKFQPWKEGDIDFVSIEISSNVTCGSTQLCKVGGYQYSRLNGNCRIKGSMIHALGKSLCLDGEEKRDDRDKYLTFQDQCKTIPEKREKNHPIGMYDYASIWHWPCNSCEGGWPTVPNVTKCGVNSKTELRILDADGINTLYNCGGCYRHRWRPVENLTHEDKTNMYSFDYEAPDGSPLYPCRGSVGGSIMVGKYNDSKSSCYIAYSTKQYEIKERFEVLTIPGGLSEQCSTYKLVNKTEVALDTLVSAGDWISNYKWKGYIAYASINKTGNVSESSVGNAWLQEGHELTYDADVSVGNEAIKAAQFKVLTCTIDTDCILKELFAERKLCM